MTCPEDPESPMRRSLFACSVLALALAASACQRTAAPADPAPAAAPAPAETPSGPAMTPIQTAPPVSSEDPQASIPEGPDMAPRAVQVTDEPCRDAIGAAASARLVQRCIQVSPATHPPCNAANPCALIQGEIDRSCAMYGPGETKPKECAA